MATVSLDSVHRVSFSFQLMATTVRLRDNVTLTCVFILASELIYSIEQRDYNLVNSSALHFMLDVYQVIWDKQASATLSLSGTVCLRCAYVDFFSTVF